MKKIIFIIVILVSAVLLYTDSISLELNDRFGFTQYYTYSKDMLYIDYPYMYGTGGSSLQIYELYENGEMDIVDIIHILNPTSMVKYENYIYISTNRIGDYEPAKILQFDISDPYDTYLYNMIEFDMDVLFIYLRLLDNHLQSLNIHTSNRTLNFYELPDMEHITTLDASLMNNDFLTKIDETYAFNIAQDDVTIEYSIAIYDYADITMPILLNTIDISTIHLPGLRPQHITLVSDNVVALCSQHVISFWDISDPVEWEFLSQFFPDNIMWLNTNHAVIDQDHIILLRLDGLELLDVSNIYEPQSVDFYYEQRLTNPIYHDDYLYCSSISKGGIRTFQIDTEEETISFDNKFHTNPVIRNGFKHSDYIFIQSLNDGIYLYDVSEPYNPQAIYIDELSVSYYHGMRINENRLILQDYSGYQSDTYLFKIYDIFQPLDPVLTHSIEFNEYWEFGYTTAHFDNYEDDTLYLVSRTPTTRIRKYDISEPDDPVLLFDEILPIVNALSARIHNGHAYISIYGTPALFIIGGLHENEPYIANIIPDFMIGDTTYLWIINENLVSYSSSSNFIEPHSYDISDPVNPSLLFKLDTVSHSSIPFCDKIIMTQQDPGRIIKNVYDIREEHTGILTSADIMLDTYYYTLLCYEYEDKELIYATSPSHISIYELTTTPISADDPAILPPDITFANFPNPFNTETTFAINLPEISEDAVIELFNIKGQLIRKLEVPPSEESVTHITWDGRDSRGRVAASGIYLAKLRNGSETYTHRVVLLK